MEQAKAVQRGKFVVMNACIKRTERFQINDLMLHLKFLEKQELAKPKTHRREIINIRAKINEMETIIKYKESMKEKLDFLKK
jgi:hypothetical protein